MSIDEAKRKRYWSCSYLTLYKDLEVGTCHDDRYNVFGIHMYLDL